MKRFLKIFLLLIAGLFALASCFNAALDHMSHSATQNSFTIYNEQGNVLLSYNGDFSAYKTLGKPGVVVVPRFLHRT